jgi:phosphoribosyl-AMP cyclohydrolase
MAKTNTPPFSNARDKADLEQGMRFAPHFNADGLIPAIVTDAATGAVVMFAWMNRDALIASITTREAHFWSRSRRKLWRKGEESGNTLTIADMRTDCDQDALLISVHITGAGVACHTGQYSCFYRRVALGAPAGGLVALAPAKS